MRIGFLIDSFAIGGTELNAVKVAESLVRRSAALTVLHFQEAGPLRQRYEAMGVEMIRVPLTGLATRSALSAIAQINHVGKSRHIDVLHAHCVYSNVVGAASHRFWIGAPPLLASRRWTGYADRPGLHRLNAIAQSIADAVLVNSPSLVAVVQRESARSKPVYIPNMLPDANFAKPSPDVRATKRIALGLPSNAPLVGCVARLVPVKDHKTLLRAWQLVVKAQPHAHLAIIGGGPLLGELQQYADSLGVSGQVHFLGEIAPQELPHSLLDVSVLSSLDEGFPNSVLESMAQGVPVVATRVGGVRDLVNDSQNGLLVEKGAATAMAGAICVLLADAGVRATVMDGGIRTAESHREGVVVDALVNTYTRISRR